MCPGLSFQTGEIAINIEAKVLLELRQSHKQPTEIFDGFTECFYDVDLEDLIERIEQLISEHSLVTA